jgi:hypothetical protein
VESRRRVKLVFQEIPDRQEHSQSQGAVLREGELRHRVPGVRPAAGDVGRGGVHLESATRLLPGEKLS